MSRAVIRDLGYQAYDGPRKLGNRVWVITAVGLKAAWKSRWSKVLGVFSLIAAAGFGVAIYLTLKVQDITGKMGVPMPKMIHKLLVADHYVGDAINLCGSFFGFFIAVLVAGPALADDLKGGGLNFHFTRPVTHRDYVIGKILPTTLAIAALALIPALMLGLMRLALSPQWEPLSTPLLTLSKGLLFSAVAAVSLSVPAVALSSLTVRRGIARTLWALLYWIPPAVGGALMGITKDRKYLVISLNGGLESIKDRLFGSDKQQLAEHWQLAVLILAAHVAVGLFLVYYRVRQGEKKG
jgi:ABC-type transport system involved in multi-copper enzyme maturation permease subunit